eukprot:jgi/Astpho2/5764/fgenesh1_pg.00080_%23_28_t
MANQMLRTFCKGNKIVIKDGESVREEPWPERSSVWCWHCCHPFTTVPLTYPLRECRGVFTCQGVYCSWHCMKAARQVYNNDPSLLALFYRDVTEQAKANQDLQDVAVVNNPLRFKKKEVISDVPPPATSLMKTLKIKRKRVT